MTLRLAWTPLTTGLIDRPRSLRGHDVGGYWTLGDGVTNEWTDIGYTTCTANASCEPVWPSGKALGW